jgi:hypothetical protein
MERDWRGNLVEKRESAGLSFMVIGCGRGVVQLAIDFAFMEHRRLLLAIARS